MKAVSCAAGRAAVKSRKVVDSAADPRRPAEDLHEHRDARGAVGPDVDAADAACSGSAGTEPQAVGGPAGHPAGRQRADLGRACAPDSSRAASAGRQRVGGARQVGPSPSGSGGRPGGPVVLEVPHPDAVGADVRVLRSPVGLSVSARQSSSAAPPDPQLGAAAEQRRDRVELVGHRQGQRPGGLGVPGIRLRPGRPHPVEQGGGRAVDGAPATGNARTSSGVAARATTAVTTTAQRKDRVTSSTYVSHLPPHRFVAVP